MAGYKILGQLKPANTTLTTLYTVPGSTEAVISSIIVANLTTAVATFRISIAVAGAADDLKQYIYYDISIPGKDSFVATLGISLSATDLIRVKTDTADALAFTVTGVEIT